jgi:hypothetical protein
VDEQQTASAFKSRSLRFPPCRVAARPNKKKLAINLGQDN